MKNYDENSNKGYFLEVHVDYPKNLLILKRIYHFYQKEKNYKKSKSLFAVYKTKKNVVYIRALKQALNHGLVLVIAWLQVQLMINLTSGN